VEHALVHTEAIAVYANKELNCYIRTVLSDLTCTEATKALYVVSFADALNRIVKSYNGGQCVTVADVCIQLMWYDSTDGLGREGKLAHPGG